MAPTIPQEAGGSGYRARRRRRRRQHSPVRQSPRTVATRSSVVRSEAAPSSQRGQKRGRAGKQEQHRPRSTSRKRARAAGKSSRDEQDAPVASASSDAERASSSSYGASSALSSPRRCPSMPRVVAANDSTRIVCANIEEQEKYFAKLGILIDPHPPHFFACHRTRNSYRLETSCYDDFSCSYLFVNCHELVDL